VGSWSETAWNTPGCFDAFALVKKSPKNIFLLNQYVKKLEGSNKPNRKKITAAQENSKNCV